MMKLVIVTILLIPIISSAAGYPGPDNIGIYLTDDAVGDVVAGCSVPQFQSVQVHLCLSLPSASTIAAWESRIEIEGRGFNFFEGWYVNQGLNVGSGDDYIVGLGQDHLLPNAQGVVKLMTMNVTCLDTSTPIRFFVKPVSDSVSFENSPGYLAGAGDLRTLEPSTGGFDMPVFVINGEMPIANESAAWGQVKSLYR